MNTTEWTWRSGSHFKIDAATAGAHIEKLRQRLSGEITPADIVDDAKDETSPLHAAFEWDDSKAAHAYRVYTARNLVGSLVAVLKDIPEELQEPTRVYVNIRTQGEDEEVNQRYTHILDAVKDPEMRAYLLNKAQRELMSWRRKYEYLQELSDVFAVVDRLAA